LFFFAGFAALREKLRLLFRGQKDKIVSRRDAEAQRFGVRICALGGYAFWYARHLASRSGALAVSRT